MTVIIRDEYGDRPATEAEIAAMVIDTSTNVNQSLTSRQIRLWLLTKGITGNTVIEAIKLIPDEIAKETALVNWEYSTVFERSNPLIDAVGSILGLTPEEIDSAFNEALTL